MLGFFHAACAEQNLSGALSIQNQACTWSPVLPKDRMVSLGQPCHAAAGTVPCHPWGSQGSSWAGAVQPCLGELLGCPRGRETRQKQTCPGSGGSWAAAGRAVCAQSPPQLPGLRASPPATGAALGAPCPRFRWHQRLPVAVDGADNFSSTLHLVISSPVTGGYGFCEGCFFTHSVADIKLT